MRSIHPHRPSCHHRRCSSSLPSGNRLRISTHIFRWGESIWGSRSKGFGWREVRGKSCSRCRRDRSLIHWAGCMEICSLTYRCICFQPRCRICRDRLHQQGWGGIGFRCKPDTIPIHHFAGRVEHSRIPTRNTPGRSSLCSTSRWVLHLKSAGQAGSSGRFGCCRSGSSRIHQSRGGSLS